MRVFQELERPKSRRLEPYCMMLVKTPEVAGGSKTFAHALAQLLPRLLPAALTLRSRQNHHGEKEKKITSLICPKRK